jgi:hypothetical protein
VESTSPNSDANDNTKPTRDNLARLMAPTYASSSKIPSSSRDSPTKSLPASKLYPDVPKVLFSGTPAGVRKMNSNLSLSPVKSKATYKAVEVPVLKISSQAADSMESPISSVNSHSDAKPTPISHTESSERPVVKNNAIGPSKSLVRTSLSKRPTARPVMAISVNNAIKSTSTVRSNMEKSSQAVQDSKVLKRNLATEEESRSQHKAKVVGPVVVPRQQHMAQDAVDEGKASKPPVQKSVKAKPQIKATQTEEKKAVKPMLSKSQLKPTDITATPQPKPIVKISKQVLAAAVNEQPPKSALKKVSYSHHASLAKSALQNQMRSTNGPHVDGVKFSSDKIKFTAANQTDVKKTTVSNPGEAKMGLVSTNSHRQVAAEISNTPRSTNHKGDDIVLPEILSESEDDEDGNVLRSWANSPDLRNVLVNQQNIDPDSVFGPIAPLHMHEVFKNSGRLSRFRPRSSSANWSGADRLTVQEMEEYAKGMGYKR